MSIAFSRTTRSMNQDSFRPGLVGLATLILILVAWLAWFFLAPIPLYETSREFQVRRSGTLLVTFPPESLGRILPGQKAALSLSGAGGHPDQLYSAEVMNVPGRGEDAVEVYLFSPPDALAQQPLPPGLVKVEVETVSPATLLLRSTGQRVNNQP